MWKIYAFFKFTINFTTVPYDTLSVPSDLHLRIPSSPTSAVCPWRSTLYDRIERCQTPMLELRWFYSVTKLPVNRLNCNFTPAPTGTIDMSEWNDIRHPTPIGRTIGAVFKRFADAVSDNLHLVLRSVAEFRKERTL